MKPSRDEKVFSDLRVLVVDDDANILEAVNFALGDMGISQITRARDGQRALMYFKERSDLFDLVICDWMMPNMSGIQFLERLRRKCPDVPFIMLTRKATHDDVFEARKHGVTAYVAKPFTIGGLQKKVRGIMKAADG